MEYVQRSAPFHQTINGWITCLTLLFQISNEWEPSELLCWWWCKVLNINNWWTGILQIMTGRLLPINLTIGAGTLFICCFRIEFDCCCRWGNRSVSGVTANTVGSPGQLVKRKDFLVVDEEAQSHPNRLACIYVTEYCILIPYAFCAEHTIIASMLMLMKWFKRVPRNCRWIGLLIAFKSFVAINVVFRARRTHTMLKLCFFEDHRCLRSENMLLPWMTYAWC